MNNILISGAASGIGAATARVFYQRGWRVGLLDINADALGELAAELGGAWQRALDVSDADAVAAALAEFTESEKGRLRLLFNCAGILRVGRFEEISLAEHARIMQVNVTGLLQMTHAAFPYLRAMPGAQVINMGSASGVYGTPQFASYSASKFAVRGFTESLMVELQESPLSVHLIHPGGINTNIAKDSPNGEEFTRKYLKTNPDDVAKEVIRCIRSGKQRLVLGHQSMPLWLMSWGVSLERRNRLLYGMLKGMLDPKLYGKVRRNAS